MPRGRKPAKEKVLHGKVYQSVSVDMLVLGAITACVIVSFIGGFLLGALVGLP